MQFFSSHIWRTLEEFLPDASMLPKNLFAKGGLILLGILGFGSIFLQTSIAQGGLSIETSLDNNTISVKKFIVTDGTTTKVVLDGTNGVGFPSETSQNRLLKLVNKYVTPAQLVSSDIGSGMITTEKIANGTITCDDLEKSYLYPLLCNKNTKPTLSCPTSSSPGQYLIGITTGAGAICTGSTAGLPLCASGQTVTWDATTQKWICYTMPDPSSTTPESLWVESLIDPSIIYNRNLTGKVGIGTTNPTERLTIEGGMVVKGVGVPDSTAILYVTGGRVGILTSNPQHELDVVGNIRAAAYIQNSDTRLKTNVQKIDNALEKIMGINGYSYDLLIDGSHHYGVIAQEVERLFPYLVTTDESGLKSVNYNGLVAPIIESLKEINTKVIDLEKQIDTNTTLINTNTSRIEALEKMAK